MRASKKGTLVKRRYFTVIGSSSVKTVADRYRHALVTGVLVLSTSMTVNYLEPLKLGVFVNFS